MGYRTNNLHSFFISKNDNEQDQNLIDMWHNLDNDYSEEGLDEKNTELNSDKGYKSKAEELIKEKDWIEDGHDDLSKIERVLNWIKQAHGSYSSQFLYEISECDEGYSIAVSYLT